MTRVLIHPGFHKTGTSSLQRGAEGNAALLAERLRFWNTSNVLDCVKVGRRYAAGGDPVLLARFAERVGALMAVLDTDDPRPILISSEDIAGILPGLRDTWGYDAAPDLLETMVAEVETAVPGAQITVWFTTREAEPWQRSVYWQNLRATRLTEDFTTYQPRLAHAARLDDIVALTAERLAGRAEVTSTRIEACADDPLGPLGYALALLGVPADGLPPLPAQNVQPDGAADALLAMNRSDIPDAELPDAKRAYLKSLRKSGQTRRDPAN